MNISHSVTPRLIRSACCAIAVVGLCATSPSYAASFEEVPLPHLGRSSPEQTMLSTDGKVAIYIRENEDGQSTVYVNGKRGQTYDQIYYSAWETESARSLQRRIAFRGVRTVVQDSTQVGNVVIVSEDDIDRTYFAIVDGKESRPYSFIGQIQVTEEGHVIYPARRNGKAFLVVDGQERELRGSVIWDDDQFEHARDVFHASPDARVIYSIVRQRGASVSEDEDPLHSYFFVVNNEYYPLNDGFNPKSFRGFGSHAAVEINRVRPDGKDEILWLVDGKPGPAFEARAMEAQRMLDAQFFDGTDGLRALYVGRRAGKGSAVVDGPEGPREVLPLDPTLQLWKASSPDGKRVALIARKGGNWVVDYEGRVGPPLGRINSESLLFSPDGSQVAYVGSFGAKNFLVQKEKAGRGCDEVLHPTWSRMNHFAYVARRAEGDTLVIDNQEVGTYNRLAAPVWTAVGDLAVLARQGNEEFLIIRDKQGAEKKCVVARGPVPNSATAFVRTDDMIAHSLVVGPVGSRAACLVTQNGKTRVALIPLRVAGMPPAYGAVYGGVTDLSFGIDDLYATYCAQLGEEGFPEKARLVINDVASRVYQGIWLPSERVPAENIQSRESESFFFGERDSKFARVNYRYGSAAQTRKLWTALSTGKESEVLAAIAAGADLRSPVEGDGHMPLYLAAKQGMVAACRVMLEKGVDPNAGGHERRVFPSTVSKPEIRELLKSAGAHE